MKIKHFTTDAQHNAYTYRHIKAKQRRREPMRETHAFISLALSALVFAQLFIGLD
jgi:hypothetical protein